MSVSGHKSVQSLSNYQCTQAKQKVQMGQVLYQAMTRSENKITVPNRRELPSTTRPALQSPTVCHPAASMATPLQGNFNPENALVPFNEDQDEVSDFDLVSILNELENNPKETEANSVSVMTTQTNVLNNVPKSMFSNCTIHNITFNIGK